VAACSGGFGNCNATAADGCEVNLATNTSHCGRCGNACVVGSNATATCAAGACGISCASGFGDCNVTAADGCEVNLQTSTSHCGVCGRTCASGQMCISGTCISPVTGSGQDGAATFTTTVTINTVRSPATGAAGAMTVTVTAPAGFAANQLVFLHQSQGAGVGAWEVASVVSVSGSTLTLASPLANAYSSAGANRAQAVVMPQYTTVSQTAGTVTAPTWDGSTGGVLAFVATGAVNLAGGSLDMSARGYRGHPRQSIANRAGEQGEGTTAYGVQSTAANTSGGGGGGRTGCECCWGGAGGGGGHAAGGGGGSAGGNACQPGGSAGLAIGNAQQTVMYFGGAGANGGADEDGHGSAGASGGGIIYVAAASITVTSGAVTSDGQAGQGEFNFAGCGSGGGGGGAGGAIYLRAPTVALGASRVLSRGGGGGDDGGNCGTPGGAGSVGRVTLRGATTVTGASVPTHATAP